MIYRSCYALLYYIVHILWIVPNVVREDTYYTNTDYFQLNVESRNPSNSVQIDHLIPHTNYSIELRERPRGHRLIWSQTTRKTLMTSMAGNSFFQFSMQVVLDGIMCTISMFYYQFKMYQYMYILFSSTFFRCILPSQYKYVCIYYL